MDGWSIALLVLVGYLAVMALARLMIRRRDGLMEEFRKRLEASRQNKAEEESDS